jgi:hypothetical protein
MFFELLVAGALFHAADGPGFVGDVLTDLERKERLKKAQDPNNQLANAKLAAYRKKQGYERDLRDERSKLHPSEHMIKFYTSQIESCKEELRLLA